ncbi:hypothetical protein BJX70DRAFT_65595 [Aspergillus crustosus]
MLCRLSLQLSDHIKSFHHLVLPCIIYSMRNISNGGIVLPDTSSLASEAEGLQDSVSRKRRHAMYFYRPPVWRYSSVQDGSSSLDLSEDSNWCDEASDCSLRFQDTCQEILESAPYVPLTDSDSDYETPLLQEESSSSESVTAPPPVTAVPESFYQTKPTFCTRLHAYRDIRLDSGERWSIQEGSLVIGLDPEYTLLESHERRLDEFRVVGGDVYVVCSLYADLWALCAKVSFNPLSESDERRRVAFLPLCAITVAPNYSAFVQRCSQRSNQEEKYPGNGLPVTPPQRSHSLTASKQVFQSLSDQLALPLAAQEIFQSLALKHTMDDFVPLDSTLEPIFSPLTSRRRRLMRRIKSSRSLSRNRGSARHQTASHYDHDLNSSLTSLCRRLGSKSDGWRQMHKRMSSSGSSQNFRWLSRRSDGVSSY